MQLVNTILVVASAVVIVYAVLYGVDRFAFSVLALVIVSAFLTITSQLKKLADTLQEIKFELGSVYNDAIAIKMTVDMVKMRLEEISKKIRRRSGSV